MHGWAVVRSGQPLEAIEVTTPVPTGTQVLLKTTFCGVCHSDLYFQDGYYDLGGGKRLSLKDRGVTLPFVPGHETVGKVVAFGPDAKGVAVGDHRLVYPWAGCGHCKRCLSGNEHMCLTPRSLGVFRNGGYGESRHGRQARTPDRLRQYRSRAGRDLCLLGHHGLFGSAKTLRRRARQPGRRSSARADWVSRPSASSWRLAISALSRSTSANKNCEPRRKPAPTRSSMRTQAISRPSSPRRQANPSTA